MSKGTSNARPAGMTDLEWEIINLPSPCDGCTNTACSNARATRCPHWKEWFKLKWRGVCDIVGYDSITRADAKELEGILRAYREEEQRNEHWMNKEDK